MDENTNVENTAEEVAVATTPEVDVENALDVTPATAVEEDEKGEEPVADTATEEATEEATA